MPTLTVIGTDAFDAFLDRGGLRKAALASEDDRALAVTFQRAELPVEIVGDLWELVREVRSPLAVRSSSLLEDALAHPFAGVYATKMTPNNQPDAETRFRRLAEAVKFVWASCFFREAREYIRATGRDPGDEKMAVILQEVVGERHGPRFYPALSGVARSVNVYPTGPARPEDGVCSLALGLGKTIVDGERCWTYSPAHPQAPPPLSSVRQLLETTQTEFWAVHMGPAPAHDPVAETEYLVRGSVVDADYDGTLRHLASTYDPRSDRVALGLGVDGPRVLNFAPLLQLGEIPLNEAVRGLLAVFAERAETPVEIEFAASFGARDQPSRLGFLQVRPMVVSGEEAAVSDEDLSDVGAVISSERALGHGAYEGIRDVVFVKRELFEARRTRQVAAELGEINRALAEEGRPYLLVGFGRWGSSDPWLGIPVVWSQVSGARVIVEAALPQMNVEMSQGAHFFQNLLSFRVAYLSIPLAGRSRVDWTWIEGLVRRRETALAVHAEAASPLIIRVDGRHGRGVVLRAEAGSQ